MSIMPKVERAGYPASSIHPEPDEDEVDDRTRWQYQAILQYLTKRELLETIVAFEAETGVIYNERVIKEASVLEASLDMFADYREGSSGGLLGKKGDAPVSAGEELLQTDVQGACITKAADAEPVALGMNVTAVCWASAKANEQVAVAATADKRLRVVNANGDILNEMSGLSSPILGLDSTPETAIKFSAETDMLVLAASMGGETLLLRLKRPCRWETDDGGWRNDGYTLELLEEFKGHSKHATCVRFAPAEEGGVSQHFVTISRDHSALVYSRKAGAYSGFALAGAARFPAEVTSVAWVSPTTFALGVRDSNCLHYWDAAEGTNGSPQERMKVNLNVLGDNVVSFAVPALAASPDRKLIAVCTDKSRVIVLPTFSSTQIRNLYGADVGEYDVPSIRFSLDGCFLYTTSSTPERAEVKERADAAGVVFTAGQVAIFDLKSGELVLKVPCHQKPVRCMDRHPYTEAVVTGSFDRTVRFLE